MSFKERKWLSSKDFPVFMYVVRLLNNYCEEFLDTVDSLSLLEAAFIETCFQEAIDKNASYILFTDKNILTY